MLGLPTCVNMLGLGYVRSPNLLRTWNITYVRFQALEAFQGDGRLRVGTSPRADGYSRKDPAYGSCWDDESPFSFHHVCVLGPAPIRCRVFSFGKYRGFSGVYE